LHVVMESSLDLAFAWPLQMVAKLALLNMKRCLARLQAVPVIVKFLSGVLSRHAQPLAAFD